MRRLRRLGFFDAVFLRNQIHCFAFSFSFFFNRFLSFQTLHQTMARLKSHRNAFMSRVSLGMNYVLFTSLSFLLKSKYNRHTFYNLLISTTLEVILI